MVRVSKSNHLAPKGCKNYSNDCYAIATLQALLSSNQLVDYLRNLSTDSYNHHPILKALYQFVKEYELMQPVEISELKRKLSTKIVLLKSLGQEDSSEFLYALIDCLVMEQKSRILADKVVSIDEFNALADSNTIFKFFYGFQINTVTCKNCKNESSLSQAFRGLDVAIKPSISQSILDYMQTSILGYQCDSCSHVANAASVSKIVSFPLILTIHVKRYNNRLNKDTCGIKSENELYFDNKNVVYRLFAIVNHHGSALESGHYTCTGERCGRWYLLDDDSITNLNNVEQNSKIGYIYLYRKL